MVADNMFAYVFIPGRSSSKLFLQQIELCLCGFPCKPCIGLSCEVCHSINADESGTSKLK